MKRYILNNKITLTLLLAAIVVFASCDKQEEEGRIVVAFNAHISSGNTATVHTNSLQTRTASGGEQWIVGDAVGIFMLSAGGVLSDDILYNVNNRQYNITDNATGALAPDDGVQIYYPQSDNVDFIAYYPYGTIETSSGQIVYNISVDGQTSEAVQNGKDILYAKKTNMSKGESPVSLEFNHILSKITLNVKAGTGVAASAIANIAAIDVLFVGMPLTASLVLQDGTLTSYAPGNFSPLAIETTPDYDVTFSALLIPHGVGASRKVVFEVGDDTYIWTISDAAIFEAQKHYTYEITVNNTGIVDVNMPIITPWIVNPNSSGAAEMVETSSMSVIKRN